ncbi:MAG: Bug family tripartite tricarboxylate transporter substrate binding protein [Xanthobacteraceae bacterium]
MRGCLSRSMRVAQIGICVTPLVFMTDLAHAQTYPSQDIHFISGFTAGSGSDVMVRYFAEKIRHLAGRTILVENRSGANGNIAIEYTARSKPDGYTILVHAGSGIAASQALFKKPPFDAGKLLRVAATINRQAFMLAVAPDSPYHTVADLTKAMKAKGDKATFGSNSTQSRIAGTLYNKAENIGAVEVQYKTGPDVIRELQSGVLDFSFQDPQMASTQAAQGKLRLLAICSGTRMDMAPNLPTMAEQGYPQFNLIGWFAATVQADTPPTIVAQINRWFETVLSTQETKDFLTSFGSDVWINTPDVSQASFLKELATWRENVAISGIEQQ